MKHRVEVSDEILLAVLEEMTRNVARRLEKHGRESFVSVHEALGVMEEERWELVEAIKSNVTRDILNEFFDVAVTCVFAVASEMSIAKENNASCNCGPMAACNKCADKSTKSKRPEVCTSCDEKGFCDGPCAGE